MDKTQTEPLPCPFCGQVPTTFGTYSNGKWGFVQCCINGPEVRASYKPIEDWLDAAIAEWNDRKPPDVVGTFEAWWNGRGMPEGLKPAFYMAWKAALNVE